MVPGPVAPLERCLFCLDIRTYVLIIAVYIGNDDFALVGHMFLRRGAVYIVEIYFKYSKLFM